MRLYCSWNTVTTMFFTVGLSGATAWQQVSPRAGDPREGESEQKGSQHIFYKLISGATMKTITFLVFYWTHRPTLIEYGRGHTKMSNPKILERRTLNGFSSINSRPS